MFSDNQTEDIKQILQENRRLLIENNQILRKMRRTSIISTVLRLIWLVVVVASLAYAYFYYIEPNIESIKDKVEKVEAIANNESSIFRKWYELIKSSTVPE